MDLWMLSRVSAAVESCNRAFETYDFPVATSACYNLWLYDLCDVYLVSIASVFMERQKLYFSLNVIFIVFLDIFAGVLETCLPEW